MQNKSCLLGRLDAKAFTLIELLVVVLIIGILAAVALPKYEMAVMRSRYATLKANVNALMDAEKIYYLANGEYTEDLEALSVDLTGCTLSNSKNRCTYPWGFCGVELVPHRVNCENTSTLQNGYVRYWDRTQYGNFACWAFTEDRTDKYHKLCEKEGGTFVQKTMCTHPDCSIYKISD
ncbi:MAG: prepilin-type N-terminal cleavage/methylation domain-containing protein [Elusimicrobiaceae bacterium]|nr:prepilin-type N-terminal cleavage/methylation domain-containing protein [Elusimicrobiaceae bacterium]